MEAEHASSSSHKAWRRVAKKERRRRIRRKAAQERDVEEERLMATLERSANYTNWHAEQEKQEKDREALEQREHDEREKLWLEDEVRAQKEWRLHQERRAKARQEKLQQEEIIRKEFETKQEALRKKREEKKRLYEEEVKKHEDLRKQIDDYIDNGAKIPEALRVVSESQSGKELCPFFSKTGACRYGESCSRNHRRVALSRVILVPGFYSHFSLEKNSAEYDTDISLEFESSETRHHFREFYDEVVPELESFGRIKTLKYCCNTEIHLRGNLYVEYRSEREAARAWRKLKGRYWAGRQLNCEFVNLPSWRNAVCGMNKCPKGRACNFLHTFRNPNDEYDVKSPPRWAKKKEDQEGSSSKRSEQRSTPKWDDFDRASTDESRNWRWSESPEPGLNLRASSNRASRRGTEDRSERRRGSRSERRREAESERSRSPSSTNNLGPQRRGSSSVRSRRTEDRYEEESDSRRDEHSLRRHAKKSRKRRTERDTEDAEDVTRKDSRISKVSKNSQSIERNHRTLKNITDGNPRAKSKAEKSESDENVDTNSNQSWTNARRPETEDAKRIAKASKARWDEVESDPTLGKDVRQKPRSLPIGEENEQPEQPSIKMQTFSTAENAWDTTDSESEEKWKERSP